MRVLLKKVPCIEENGSGAADYIQDALGRHRKNSPWDRVALLLQPFGARLCMGPHPVGQAIYVVATELPPTEVLTEARMLIHNRHHKHTKEDRSKAIRAKRSRKFQKLKV